MSASLDLPPSMRRPLRLAAASLGLPIATLVISAFFVSQVGSWNAIGMGVVALLAAMLGGTGLAVASLMRGERWPLLAWLGLLINLGPLLLVLFWIASKT